jgi:hypothetical protein
LIEKRGGWILPGIVRRGGATNRTRGRARSPIPGTGYAVLCGTRIQIRGIIRHVMRDYPAQESAACRVIPDNPAYSRITGFRDFFPGVVVGWPGCKMGAGRGALGARTDGDETEAKIGNLRFEKGRKGGEGCFEVSEERRIRSAAVQNAGARSHLVQNPMSQVQSRDPEAATNVPTQVVDISSKMTKSCVASRLISRRLRRKQAFFGAFLTRKGVDFSPLTKILPEFFIGREEAGETAQNIFACAITRLKPGANGSGYGTPRDGGRGRMGLKTGPVGTMVG